MDKTAKLSDDGRYRYQLTRTWDVGRPLLGFLMLNPSTADALADDPTIRKCVGFARRGAGSGDTYGGVIVVNLYAYRAAQPRRLWDATDPIGPDNDEAILDAFREADHVLAAWGASKPRRDSMLSAQEHRYRVENVQGMVAAKGYELECLGVSAGGHPRHPLMLPYCTSWEPFQ